MIQRTVNNIGSSLNVSIFEKHKFNEQDLKKYLKIFKEYKLKNIILSKSFYDMTWELSDFIGNKRHLNFDLGYLNEFSIALKCFILIQLSSNYTTGHVATVHSSIRRICILTKGFQKDEVGAYEEYLYTLSYASRFHPVYHCKQFLQYIELNDYHIFDIELGSYNGVYNKNRDLPNYELIIDFHYLITDFEKHADSNYKSKYYPIILWWKITGLIPMRPKELCFLEYNCNFIKDDEYFIKLPRSKKKAKSNTELFVEDTVKVNQDIYIAIEDYKSTIPDNLKGKYLFSHSNQSRFFGEGGKNYKRKKDMYPPNSLNILLKNFYKEILNWQASDFIKIEEDKKVTRNYITLGDTRHFSICNLMLQGINPLIIAKMAGHVRISTQRNYWGHIENFVESSVYLLTQKNRINRLDKALNTSVINFEDKINESKIFDINDFGNLQEVEHGYCKNEEFPEGCSGECRFCDYYFFKPKKWGDGIEWLQNHSHSLEQQLITEVRSLLGIFKNMKFNISLETYSVLDQEKALSKANIVNHIISQKAKVDSLLPKRT